MRPLERVFGELFTILRTAGYEWKPSQPERLLELRKASDSYPILQRCFGLGVKVSVEELMAEGFSEELALEVLELSPSVSRMEEIFVPHSHWPAKSGAEFVYLGQESMELLRLLRPHLEKFEDASVLDLGSGSGALSFEIASLARKGLGLDSSSKAVRWSQAAALAQGFTNLSFRASAIGTPAAESAVQGGEWNRAVLNPPFAIPFVADPRPHRDGGKLGIELPLLFLQFAAKHLVSKGELFCMVTNPIMQGRPAFFDRLDRKIWDIAEKTCLHDQFNYALYRKERYAEQGIQRVELCYLHLIKK
jgi:SAM-dependent methyltransferase